MTKQVIKQKLYECKNDDDIQRLIKERMEELRIDTDITVGVGYTNSFDEFISDKVHYKTQFREGKDKVYPDLVYDDMDLYLSLIKNIKEGIDYDFYNELTIFTKLFHGIYKNLPNYGSNIKLLEYERRIIQQTALMHGRTYVSIRDYIEEQCALCSEKAGLSHNVFRILGIDSSLIIGKKDNVGHAYNIVYPRGYNTRPSVLFDPSFYLNFANKDNKNAYMGYFKVLSNEEYEKLKSGEEVVLDFGSSEGKLKLYYDFLNQYQMKPEVSTYSIELEKTDLEKKNTELQELENEEEILREKQNQLSRKNIGEV